MKKALHELVHSEEISVTTFRKGDKADPGYREIFQNLVFAEAELLVEFGYPDTAFRTAEGGIGGNMSMNHAQAAETHITHFTIKSLLKFALPTILMMIFMGLSIYDCWDTRFLWRDL